MKRSNRRSKLNAAQATDLSIGFAPQAGFNQRYHLSYAQNSGLVAAQ
jgi:hypothetical protein